MQPSEIEAVLDSYYAALKSGNSLEMRDVVSDDIEVIYQDAEGLLPWGGTWTGFEKFQEFLATVAKHLEIEAVVPIERAFVGDRAFIVLHGMWRSKDTKQRVEARVVNIFRVNNEKVSQYQVFPDTAAFAIATGRLNKSRPSPPSR